MLKNFGTDVVGLVKNYKTLNAITGEQITKVNDYADALNTLKDTNALTTDSITGLYNSVESLNSDSLAYYFQSVAEGAENARVNIVDAYAAILDGNTHGLKNVQSIMNTFNNSFDGSVEKQKEFTKAVGQTNTSLSNYLSTVKTDGSASLKGYAGYLVKATAKSIGLQVATTALQTAISFGISAAIGFVITKVSEVVNAYDNAIEKIEDFSDSIKNSNDKLKSINEELSDTKVKLNELSKIETPNLFQQDEIDRLKAYNDELERQYRIEKYNQQNAINDANKTSQEMWRKKMGYDISAFESVSYGTKGDFFAQEVEYLNNYEKALQRLANVESNFSNGIINEEQYNKAKENWEKKIKEYESELTKIVSDLEVIRLGFDPTDSTNDEAIKLIDTYIQKFDKLRGKTPTTFTEIYDSAEFATVTKQLEDLAKQGKLTAETFAKIDGVDKFVKALTENGVLTSIPDIISSIISKVQELDDVSNNVSDNFTFDTAKFEELQKTLDDTFSNQSTLQSAFDKIQEGSSLSADEVRKLLELCKDSYPEIATAFTKTADGYTIGANDIISANEAITKSIKEELQNQINEYQNIVDAYNDKKLSPPTINSYIDYQNYQNYSSELSNLEIEANKAQSAIDVLSLVMEMFGLTVDSTVTKLEDIDKTINNLISKSKTLTSAIQEQDENGQLSADTIMDIVEAGASQALVIDEITGAVRLNKEELINWVQAQYDEQISLLQTQVTLLETSNRVIDFTEKIANCTGGVFNAAIAFSEFAKSVTNSDEKVKELEGRIAALNVARNNVGKYTVKDNTGDPIKEAFEKDMAETEHLHNMELMSDEEYYNALEKANNDHYKNSLDHESEYNSNLEKIFNGRKQIYKKNVDDEVALLDERLEKGFISAEQYKEQVIGLAEKYYGQGSKYYDTDFATENFETLEDKALNVDDQIYEDRLKALKETEGDSLESHNEFIAEWKALNKEIYKDLNPKKYKENLDEIEKYDKEYIENRDKKLADDEKAYWEWHREQLEKYYDEELKKLQEITDQEERISKQKELQLKLMKAQDDLLKAKKNRNQLVFSNGGWEYDYNQDDIISKMEAVADAQKDVADNQKENQKDDIEKEKEEALAPFDNLIKAISDYIDKLNGNIIPTESNPEVLEAVAKNAEQVQKDDKKRAESLSIVNLESFLQDRFPNYNKEAVSAGYLYEKFIGNSLSIPNEIAKNLIDNGTTYNNSTVNNSETFTIQNMSISVPQGTTAEQVQSMIDQFGKGVLNAMRANKAKVQ